MFDRSKPEGLRFPTDEELVRFQADPELRMMRWALNEVRERFGPTNRMRDEG
jgi:hypothetical protein